MNAQNYTFGDQGEASVRLRRLAKLYEPETRALLLRGTAEPPNVAVDLGCGPGWTTQLLRDVLKPRRTVGLDASQRFVEEARRDRAPELEFHVHDVAQGCFPVAEPDVLFCRFLLTHLPQVPETLAAWARVAGAGATLFIHETESLESKHAAIDRYYELVGQLQEHYGQSLYAGALLAAFVERSGWRIVESQRVILEKPGQKMAELHLSNLRTWRHDRFAEETFDAHELDALEGTLARIVSGEEQAGLVVNAARQIVARRAGGDLFQA